MNLLRASAMVCGTYVRLLHFVIVVVFRSGVNMQPAENSSCQFSKVCHSLRAQSGNWRASVVCTFVSEA